MRYSLLSTVASLKSSLGGSGGAASDEDILRWAREKVASTGSTVSMRDLHDKSLSSGRFLVELLAAVEPRCVDRELVTPGVTAEEKKLNAKYAISSARKLGCTLFLLWEDIVEVSHLPLPSLYPPSTLPCTFRFCFPANFDHFQLRSSKMTEQN